MFMTSPRGRGAVVLKADIGNRAANRPRATPRRNSSICASGFKPAVSDRMSALAPYENASAAASGACPPFTS